jgi:hypothetical protein
MSAALVSGYTGFRIAVFALLAGNTAYYLVAGTLAKGLDAAAWLVLLALYALEAGMASRALSPRVMTAMHVARFAAAIGVCAAGIGYVVEGDTLDAVNAALWIAVVVLLEIEVRRPLEVARHRRWFTSMAVILYSGLAALVVAWGWNGAWLDAYDAALWLIAFATIEMDVLNLIRP